MEIFSPGHLIPLLIIAAVLFFGWKQLPDMAKSVGKSLRIFKTEMKGMSDDDEAREARKAEAIEGAPVPPATPPAEPTASSETAAQPSAQPSTDASKPSAE
ncbi:MAG TPA: twin-arginine translocase TatA/TatE family subunit [Jatrophihabitantaceae bacterium]|jgi:sec-independent protein translocase protein TatA